MTSLSDHSLVSKCFYSADGVFCNAGHLYKHTPETTEGVIAEPVRLEGLPIQCPVCEGKGMLLTNRGRELLAFLEVFARPMLRDLVDEFLEERKQL